MKFVEIEGTKITPVGSKRGFNVDRVAIFLVKNNDFPIAEWRDDAGLLQTAVVAKLDIKFPPVPVPEAPRAEAPPRLAPKPPKKKD